MQMELQRFLVVDDGTDEDSKHQKVEKAITRDLCRLVAERE